MNLKKNVILLKALYLYSYMYCLKTINYTDKLNDPKKKKKKMCLF